MTNVGAMGDGLILSGWNVADPIVALEICFAYERRTLPIRFGTAQSYTDPRDAFALKRYACPKPFRYAPFWSADRLRTCQNRER